ncbi:MAG TPA: hypothetical protein VI669_10940 [Vicinamibacteria bacterium]
MRPRLTTVLLAALAAVQCRGALQELGHEGFPGAVALDGCAVAIASRFGPIELDPALRAARPRLARDSLSPSRLLDDPVLWTRRQGSRRWLEFGARGALPYRVGVRPPSSPTTQAGAYRGRIRLEALGPSDFEWEVQEDLSIGRVRADSLAQAAYALLGGLEAQAGAGLPALARASLPRSAAAFGRLFTLEPASISRAVGGGVRVTLGAAIEPARIRAVFPRYARFLEEYLAPSRLRLVVADPSGVPFWEFESRDGRLSLRFRVFGGALGPLDGPPRPMPDRLRARAAASVKSGPFRVGVEDLVADVALRRTSVEKSFRATFTVEPSWQLPFVAKPFLRAPLRRPFQEEGARFSMSVRETAEGATVLDREYRFVVRESWVVRWLGSFGGGMATVFRAGAEAEADRFMGECLWALRDDLVALATSPTPRHP